MEDHKHKSSPEFEKRLKLLESMEIPYRRDKAAVWEELSQKIASKPKSRLIALPWLRVAAAAVIVLVSTITFMRFYTTTVDCQRGEHLVYHLPDHSVVQLNAASTISYAPYWWYFKRELSLEGEAFFDVKKGSSFTVRSEQGQTEVLGTSFNIYARDANYEVFCQTGKVKVSTIELNQSIVLTPNEKVLLEQNKLKKETAQKSTESLGWMNNKFHFENVKLGLAIQELERQYDVTILYTDPTIFDLDYMGFWDKNNDIEVALELIEVSFNLKVIKVNDELYQLEPNQ